MPEPTVHVLSVDPYDKVLGLLVPAIVQRILEFARVGLSELDPMMVASSYMSRLFMRDPNVDVLAFVEPNGKVVGHAIGTLETDGTNKWVFVQQCRADGNVGDAVQRAIAYADEWGRQRGATAMLFATNRADSSWKRKYGFETVRHVMYRELGAEGMEHKE